MCEYKGLATLDAFASRHGMDPFRQFVKLSVNEWSRPYWMRYGYVTVNALRHVMDMSISAKSMCFENRIDASGSSVFLHIFTSDTEESFSSHARSMAGSGEGIRSKNLKKVRSRFTCALLTERVAFILSLCFD